MLVEPVLDSSERALWRRYERGLLTVGVGDATRPFTSGEYFDEGGSRAFFEALREHFGSRFSTAITAGSVEHQTEDLLEEVGVDEPRTMHYGEEKSRGDFGDEDVGALNGCIDPGDDYVIDLLAEAGLNARPETQTDEDGEERRAHGRGFVGPDADAAASLLASVREQHVAQAAGRYARNADNPDDRAIVFVRTDAAPAGFLDLQVPGVEWLPTDDQAAIVDALRGRRDATARELAEVADVTKEHVRKTLRRLHDKGVVDVRQGAGDHGAHVYRALSGLGSGECVDLSPETTNDHVWGTYTWALAIDAPLDAQKAAVATTDALSKDERATAGSDDHGDPPS
jgi:DNA-binding transcriptional ArsR family regulator